MNLPEIYARVVAKRPELAVPDLCTLDVLIPKSDQTVAWWYGRRGIGDVTAAALILARWVEALPVHHGLTRAFDTHGPRWYIEGIVSVWPCADTPIEALAAFYLGDSQ